MQPVTIHPAFAELYKKDFFIEDQHLNAILAMGKQALPELEKMIDQAIDHFKEIEEESWHENFFFLHALYLLNEMDTEESLPYMLKVAAQNHAFLDYWFSDSVDPDVPELIAKLGRNQPEVCINFLQDKNLYVQSRFLVEKALILISTVNPEKRELIQYYFSKSLRFVLDNKNKLRQLFPNTDDLGWFTVRDYIAYLVIELQNYNFTELEPEIRACYRQGLVNKEVTIEEDLVFQEPEKPEFPTIREKYEEIKQWNGEYSPFHPNAAALAVQRQKAEEEARLELARWQRKQEREMAEAEAMPVRTDTKIGRNDPCPCGSGKKYKKCCME